MSDVALMTPGEKRAHLFATTQTPGWDILVARFRRNRDSVLEQMLDRATSDTDTLALKRAFVFMTDNDPQKLADTLVREFRSKDRSAEGLNPTA